MLKKAGLLTVGITAGLLAVAPIASAGESESKGDNDHSKSWDKGDDDHHGKKKHHSDNDGGDQEGTGNVKCAGEGGDASTDNEGGEGLLGGVVQAGSVASGNGGQLLSCNSFLNDILNDNELNVLSSTN